VSSPPVNASVETVRLELVRDFVAEMPTLRGALRETEPWLTASLESLRAELPLPQSTGSFVAKPFYRPPGSDRSFYYCPGSLAPGWPSPRAGRAVVAFKGVEPRAADFDGVIEHLQLPRASPHRIGEHFVREERKIPACVSLAEASQDAARAADVQVAHLQAYGTLGRFPLPLFVFRHADEAVAAVLERLRAVLSDRTFETVEPWVQAGLGVYVYYYPTPPTRARDIDSILERLGFRQRSLALLRLCDPDRIVLRWVSAFVRMLYLGFSPGSLDSYRTGICCQPQNACIDGGFVDLDSVTPFAAFRDDRAVDVALQFSVESLFQTVRALVAGTTDAAGPQSQEVRVDLHHLNLHLLALIEDALEREGRPGLSLDGRVRRYFTPARSYEALMDRLVTYYSPRTSAVVASASTFPDFGMALITAARDEQTDR
jgi:hypothetical protein